MSSPKKDRELGSPLMWSETVVFRQLGTGRWFRALADLCGDRVKFPWVLGYNPIMGHYVLRTTLFDLLHCVEHENYG